MRRMGTRGGNKRKGIVVGWISASTSTMAGSCGGCAGAYPPILNEFSSFPCTAWECVLDASHPVTDTCRFVSCSRACGAGAEGFPCGAWEPEARFFRLKTEGTTDGPKARRLFLQPSSFCASKNALQPSALGCEIHPALKTSCRKSKNAFIQLSRSLIVVNDEPQRTVVGCYKL